MIVNWAFCRIFLRDQLQP